MLPTIDWACFLVMKESCGQEPSTIHYYLIHVFEYHWFEQNNAFVCSRCNTTCIGRTVTDSVDIDIGFLMTV